MCVLVFVCVSLTDSSEQTRSVLLHLLDDEAFLLPQIFFKPVLLLKHIHTHMHNLLTKLVYCNITQQQHQCFTVPPPQRQEAYISMFTDERFIFIIFTCSSNNSMIFHEIISVC